MTWPAAGLRIDEALVRRLLREQYPDLTDRPLRNVNAGFDNELWRRGDGRRWTGACAGTW
jgi:hypothetical protein